MRGPAPGERAGHRGGAGDARLLRHLDRPRQRLRRPRDRGRARTGGGAAGRTELHAAADLADRRRRNRATTTASPTRDSGRSATSPTCGRCFAHEDWQPVRDVNRALRRRGGATRRRPTIPVVLVQDYHFALLPRHDRASAAQARPSSPSGTSPGRTRSPSASAPGATRSSKGCWAAPSSASTRRFHCKNFLETVDRYLETRIEHDRLDDLHGGQPDAGRELPDLDPMARAGWQTPPAVARVPRRGAQRARAPPDAPAGRRRRPAGLHQGHPGALPGRRTAARAASRMDRALHLRPDRGPSRIVARGVPGLRGAGRADRGRRSTRASATAAYEPDRPAGRAPRAAKRSSATTARRTSAWSPACTTA